MNKWMYIFIGITDWVGAGRLCSATRAASSDRCHYRHGKQGAKSPTIQYEQCSKPGRVSFCTMYVRLNPPPPQQRYSCPVSVDKPIQLSVTLLCCIKERYWRSNGCFMSGIMCVLLSKVYIQANSVLIWIVWTIVTLVVIGTYSSSIFINT